jgi:hypothetical protein
MTSGPEPGDAAWFKHPEKRWIRVVVAGKKSDIHVGKDECTVVAVDEPDKFFVVNCAELRAEIP